jgi:predicted nucleotidyltransferase
LGGSYGRGDPTEDSDVDMMVYFRGDSVSTGDVLDALYGQVIGYGGVFDIIPKNVDLEAEYS